MAVYAICTGSMRNEAFVPVIFRFENFSGKIRFHKIPLFQRVLWWARQGLNLRPHPCEGNWRSRVSRLKLRDIFRPPNLPCTSFVRGPLVYGFAVPARASSGRSVTRSAADVMPKCGGSAGGPRPPGAAQKTAGRAATLRSGSLNSCAAMAESYRSADSRASVICGGGMP